MKDQITTKLFSIIVPFLTIESLFSGNFAGSSVLYYLQQKTPLEANSTINTVDVELERDLDNLAVCECRDCSPNYKRVDDNNFFSYGQFQFQLGTFTTYGVKYGLLVDGLEEVDYRNLINDYSLQRDIAREMIKDGGWGRWRNCAIKLGKLVERN